MKKLVLATILGFGFLMIGCATSEKTTATNEKTTNSNAKNLSDNPLYKDCIKNENKNSCQRLIDGGLPSVEKCEKSSCANAGRVYEAVKNYQQAMRYYQKACEANEAWSCASVGFLYEETQVEKANLYFKKSCDLGYEAGCGMMGLAYASGNGVKQDYSKARAYWERACGLDYANGCYDLGALHHNGQGVKRDYSVAKKYFGKACDLGHQRGCDNYKMLDERGVK